MRDIRIMDIAVNLARIGNWAADDFDGKQKRIRQFLEQTRRYLNALDVATYPPRLQRTLDKFRKTFATLDGALPERSSERGRWAEAMLTWSNILTHRAKLAD